MERLANWALMAAVITEVPFNESCFLRPIPPQFDTDVREEELPRSFFSVAEAAFSAACSWLEVWKLISLNSPKVYKKCNREIMEAMAASRPRCVCQSALTLFVSLLSCSSLHAVWLWTLPPLFLTRLASLSPLWIYIHGLFQNLPSAVQRWRSSIIFRLFF